MNLIPSMFVSINCVENDIDLEKYTERPFPLKGIYRQPRWSNCY